MTILYLYAEVMGYTMATIKSLVDHGNTIHLVYWDEKKITPYRFSKYKNLHTYSRSSQSYHSLKSQILSINPDITVVSGWQDTMYLKLARFLRRNNKIVVIGFDDQWHGTFRQQLGSFLGKCGLLNLFFSHAWISGMYQFEFARKLGFKKESIVYDLYSADLSLFHSVYYASKLVKKVSYPHRFIFVGRLEKVKGLENLISAWNLLGSRRKDWELVIIGSGTLKDKIINKSRVVLIDFLQPKDLINEIPKSGCFILPSIFEPWGVVVHEFAAAGLPLIVSNCVGASTEFLVHGLNGYLFNPNSVSQLSKAMLNVISKSDEELIKMGACSHDFSFHITPETSAYNLISISTNYEH